MRCRCSIWREGFVLLDGRAPSLRAQSLMPIVDHREMDESLERVVAKLAPSMVITSFPSSISQPVTPATREKTFASSSAFSSGLKPSAFSRPLRIAG